MTCGPSSPQRIRQCFFDFRFPEAMRRDLGGNDRFWPATYAQHWAPVRAVADAVNAPYNRAALGRREPPRTGGRAAPRQQQQQQQQQQPAAATPRRGVAGPLRSAAWSKEYVPGKPVLRGIDLDRAGGDHRHHRPLRHGQVHADPLHQPPGGADGGRDPAAWRGPACRCAGRAAPRAAADRHGLPGIQPGRAADGDGERALRAARLRAALARLAAEIPPRTSPAPSSCWTRSACPTTRRGAPMRSRAGSASASASRAR
jgi:hypothetical protein